MSQAENVTNPASSDPDSWYFLLGTALLAWVVGLLTAGCAFMLLGGRAGTLSMIIAAVGAVGVTYRTAKICLPARHRYATAVVCGISAAIFGLGLLLSVAIYDSSWDGQTYQAQGILGIADGWNIYREDAPQDAFLYSWVALHSKGIWITEGTIVAATGNVEAGKALNFVLMAASFAFAVPAVSRLGGLRGRKALVAATLIAINPMMIAQLFTYYADGQLAAALSMVVCLLILFEKRPGWLVAFPLALASILLMSLKLNGAIYLTVIVTGYAVWYWLTRRRGGRILLMCGLLAYTVGFVVNANPLFTMYARQMLEHGNPFHPTDWQTLTGIESQTPEILRGKSWPERLFISLFSHYMHVRSVSLKIPLTFSPAEIVYVADARIGGFGPWFSGGLILALIAFASRALRRPVPALVWVLFGLMAGSILTSPEAWWARYIPQLWLLAILMAVAARPDGLRWAGLARRLAFGVLIINVVFLVLVMLVGVRLGDSELRAHFARLAAETQTEPLDIDFRGSVLTQRHFDDYGVKYVEIDGLPCQPPQLTRLVPSAARVCRD